MCGDVMKLQSHSIPLAELGVATLLDTLKTEQGVVTYTSPIEVFVTGIKIFDWQKVCLIVPLIA